MIWIDIGIVAIIALSAIVGFLRGFLKEAVGLATWILAFYLAFIAAVPVSDRLAQWIQVESARLAAGFVIVFLLVLIAGAIVNYLLSQLVSSTGLAGTDRIIGIAFGAIRGIAVLVVLVLLGGLTPLPQESWWQDSTLMGPLESGALSVRGYLPTDMAEAIHYSD